MALLRCHRLQLVHGGAAEQAPLQKALSALLTVRAPCIFHAQPLMILRFLNRPSPSTSWPVDALFHEICAKAYMCIA